MTEFEHYPQKQVSDQKPDPLQTSQLPERSFDDLLRAEIPHLFLELKRCTANRDQGCEVAQAPLHQLRQLVGRVISEDGRSEAQPLYDAIETTARLIDDFRSLWKLHEPLLLFKRRLDWIENEIHYITVKLHSETQFDPDDEFIIDLNLCRQLGEENENGVPEHWHAVGEGAAKLINRDELYAPVRKLGAEIYLRQVQLSQLEAEKISIADFNIDRFILRLSLIRGDIKNILQEHPDAIPLESQKKISNNLDELVRVSHRWDRRLRVVETLPEWIKSTREFLTPAMDLIRNISHLTVLENVQNAAKLKLMLVEFDSEYSGVPHSIVPKIVELYQELSIDPHESRPQEGFGRPLDEASLTNLLKHIGARLFCLLRESEIVGFYVFLPTQNVVPEKLEGIFEKIRNSKFDGERVLFGWAEMVGVSRSGRLSLHREGVDAHELLDQVMFETALYENVDWLCATVREDPPNTSKKANLRMGWQETGIYHRTPYALLQVLCRPCNNSEELITDPKRTKRQWTSDSRSTPGLAHSFVGYLASDVDARELQSAQSINDTDALELAKGFFREMNSPLKVEGAQGALSFYIRIIDGNMAYNLSQVRAGTDYWFLLDEHMFGDLKSVLERIKYLEYGERNTYSWDD